MKRAILSRKGCMQSWRKRSVFVAVGTAAALVLPASAATQNAPTGASTHVDQVTMDVNYSLSGLQLQINAANIVTVSSGAVTSSSGAVANISDFACSASGCSNSNFAECYPVGNAFGDQTLPSGALRFGPDPSEATLKASFTCTRVFVGGDFLLTVDLAWSGTSIFRGGGWRNGYWFASISGTASDGTTDFNNPPKTGVIGHQTY